MRPIPTGATTATSFPPRSFVAGSPTRTGIYGLVFGAHFHPCSLLESRSSGEAIEALLALTDEETGTRDTEVERLEAILEETTEALRERLWDAFQGNQLEAPVERLLRAMYAEDAVDKKAGPGEQGADYLIESTDPFGHIRRTVVQLKAWKDKAHDQHALHQLENTVEAYSPIDEAILLTTADGEADEFAASRQGLAERLGCPVRFVDGATLAALFLANLPDIAVR
jgi:hypothetical protein